MGDALTNLSGDLPKSIRSPMLGEVSANFDHPSYHHYAQNFQLLIRSYGWLERLAGLHYQLWKVNKVLDIEHGAFPKSFHGQRLE